MRYPRDAAASVRPPLVIALALVGAAVLGYGVYLYLQARAARALFSSFAAPPRTESPANQALRARLAALSPSAPLRDWLRLMSDDRDSVTLDSALAVVGQRQGLAAQMTELLAGSRSDALLALRWLGLVRSPDAALDTAADAALTRLCAELPRLRPSEDELFAPVLACETRHGWQLGWRTSGRATCAAWSKAIAALGGGEAHSYLLRMLDGLLER